MIFMSDNSEKMPTSRKNLRLMIAGLVVMVSGLVMLSGGASSDPDVFSYDIFNFRRMVAAPVIIISGLIVEVIAIIRKPRKEE